MECRNIAQLRVNDKRTRRRKKSFTEALKEKYCVEDEPAFDFIIVSPKKKNHAAELGHLQTVVLNEMNVTRADIPCHGLMSLCPNVVDLDLANNLLDKWTELLAILSHLPKVKYVNVSRNSLRLNMNDPFPETKLSVENLALNDTGVTFEEIAKLSAIMPMLKELHLCGNNYDNLADIDARIREGALSSLECLRLNNNRITSWSEVWKLRYLPHLKFLVLSGNPVKDVFYETASHSTKEVGNSVKTSQASGQEDSGSAVNVPGSQGSTCVGDICFRCTPASSQVSDTGTIVSNSSELMSNHVVVTDLVLKEDVSAADVFDKQDDEYSSLIKCNNALDSEDSDDNSDREKLDSDCDDIMSNLFDNESIPDDTNFNNSKSSHLNSQFFAPDDVSSWIDSPSAIKDNEPDFPSTLYGINSTNVTCSSELLGNNSESVMNSNKTTAYYHLPEKSNAVSDTTSHSSSNFDLYQFIIRQNKMEMDPYTPRAFMFDEESLTPIPHLGNAVKKFKPKTQRCLFRDASDCWDQQDKCVNSCSSVLHPNSQSESDSCSDIEAEQKKSKHSKAMLVSDHLATCLHSCTLDNENIVLESFQSNSYTDLELINQPNHLDSSCNASSSEIQMHRTLPGCCKIKPETENQHRNFHCSIDPSAETSTHSKNVTSTANENGSESLLRPFEQLQILCLSNASLSHYNHLIPFMLFPKLTNLRLKNNPLYSAVNADDRRKLYIASLPTVNILNGSEISGMEREKAERHYLRYYMDKEEKPEFYHTLVKKHGPPVKLVDIDLSAGYQEWATLKFLCEGEVQFTRRIHLVEPVSKLRNLIAMQMALPKRCFVLYHYACGPSHPESERELTELRCESLPMSRFDFAEGDEIHIDVRG